MSTTVRKFVEAFVVLHAEGHVAHLALEARLVPYFLKALQLLHRVDSLLALGALLAHPDLALLTLTHPSFLFS